MLRPDSPIGRLENRLSHDMTEHARRLTAFKAATADKVWQQQRNGEWWLVPVIDGSSSSLPA